MDRLISLTALSLFASSAAQADPTTSFNGVVALEGCSGAIFQYEGQPMDDQALVLTNGHCIGMLGPYEVLVHEPYQVDLTAFGAENTPASTWRTTEIVYGTMRDTDLAVLRLDATYQEILDTDGAVPLRLSDVRPDAGIPIAITSGFWEYIAVCEIDGFVPVMQEGAWIWTDSVRFSQPCETFGGTSGSPVISVETGEIVAVNNTGYEGGEPCSVNNPCEIDDDGTVRVETDGSYGQQTYTLYSCIDDAFALDLDRPDCALPIPRGVLGLGDVGWTHGDECDADAVLDAGETAVLSIEVFNDGPVALEATELTLSASSPALVFPDGATVAVPSLAPWSLQVVDVAIALEDGAPEREVVDIDLVVTDPEAAESRTSAVLTQRVQFDVLPQSVAIDDVEQDNAGWSVQTDIYGADLEGWRPVDLDGNTVWHADDLGTYSELALISPPMEVGDGDFVVSFDHRYKFEESDSTFWDGGVIEISTDDGVSWQDVRELTDVGYGGRITTESGNSLGDRRAFVGTSEGLARAAHRDPGLRHRPGRRDRRVAVPGRDRCGRRRRGLGPRRHRRGGHHRAALQQPGRPRRDLRRRPPGRRHRPERQAHPRRGRRMRLRQRPRWRGLALAAPGPRPDPPEVLGSWEQVAASEPHQLIDEGLLGHPLGLAAQGAADHAGQRADQDPAGPLGVGLPQLSPGHPGGDVGHGELLHALLEARHQLAAPVSVADLVEHAAQPGVDPLDREHPLDRPPHRYVGRPIQVHGAHRLGQAGDVALADCREHGLLAPEVLVDRADRDPGPLGDLVGGHARADGHQQLCRRLHHRVDQGSASRLLGRSARGATGPARHPRTPNMNSISSFT